MAAVEEDLKRFSVQELKDVAKQLGIPDKEVIASTTKKLREKVATIIVERERQEQREHEEDQERAAAATGTTNSSSSSSSSGNSSSSSGNGHQSPFSPVLLLLNQIRILFGVHDKLIDAKADAVLELYDAQYATSIPEARTYFKMEEQQAIASSLQNGFSKAAEELLLVMHNVYQTRQHLLSKWQLSDAASKLLANNQNQLVRLIRDAATMFHLGSDEDDEEDRNNNQQQQQQQQGLGLRQHPHSPPPPSSSSRPTSFYDQPRDRVATTSEVQQQERQPPPSSQQRFVVDDRPQQQPPPPPLARASSSLLTSRLVVPGSDAQHQGQQQQQHYPEDPGAATNRPT